MVEISQIVVEYVFFKAAAIEMKPLAYKISLCEDGIAQKYRGNKKNFKNEQNYATQID